VASGGHLSTRTAYQFDPADTSGQYAPAYSFLRLRHEGFANRHLRQVFGAGQFGAFSGGEFYAQNFSSFDSLEFRRRKHSANNFSVLNSMSRLKKYSEHIQIIQNDKI